MKWNEFFDRLFCKPQPAPAQTSPAAPDPDTAPNPNYRDPRYLELAKQCSMGDIAAMMELAQWHYSHLRPSTRQLLDEYDAGTDHAGALSTRTNYGSPDRFSLQACITWRCQAARYGHAEAQRLVQGKYLYRSCGVLKESTHKVGHYGCEHYYSSSLNCLGLLDIDSDFSEFGMYALRPDGIFVAYYLADYIPADSDGFGREDDYANVYYDEFFNRIPGRTLAQAQANLPRLLKKREAYWADPAHDRAHRMYKRLHSETA